MSPPLEIRAGAQARRQLSSYGFRRDDFTTLLGASGGPKWLVLSGIDRVLCRELLPARQLPLHLLGSSIGAWRHLCFAQEDPLAALQEFERAYTAQVYTEKPTGAEVLGEMERVLEAMLGDTGEAEILKNPLIKTHILTTRSRGILAADQKVLLGLGLGVAALANSLSRRTLGVFFERYVLHTGEPVFGFKEFTTRQSTLMAGGLRPAILASGSVPLLIPGVENLPGAGPGVYRDGGILDYHFDFRFTRPPGLILFPHFFSRISPGWFDKALPWRRPAAEDLGDVVQLAPSAAFLAKLPGGRVPDRTDFETMTTAVRRKVWTEVLKHAEDLAEDLSQLLQGEGLLERLQPFPGT